MNKRYQVFISSTYADLKEERSKVIQTIMELDCIPAGMEIFPAIDEEQFNFIKRVIDDCDYYLLIIGGRYGSVSEDGLSYTEKEYDYAIEIGLKVIAFIHGNPDSIAFGKSEQDQALRAKLDLFKEKVSKSRLVKFWNNAEDLPGLVALSLSKTIKTYPAVGWVRATGASSVDLLQELNSIRKENTELNEKLQQFEKEKSEDIKYEDLAGLEDKIKTFGTHTTSNGANKWEIEVTWGEIFELISPYLLESPNDGKASTILSQALFDKTDRIGYNPKIDAQLFQTIKIQLNVLGLVNISYSKTVQGGMALFWTLTKKGKRLMLDYRTVRKS